MGASASTQSVSKSDSTPLTPASVPVFESGDASPMSPQLVRLGRHRIVRRVGVGGMGEVYEAIDGELDRRLAIKIVRTGGDPTEHELRQERLVREARALAKLSHPNVVGLFDVGVFEDIVYIVMEYVDGQTLADWMSSKARAWSEVVPMFMAIGEGLVAAHESGLVHRDFKPSNVLVDHEDRPRLVDFGLAKLGQDVSTSLSQREMFVTLTEAGRVVGTPAYMSPEQLRGQLIDARSDQYAFCVTLYEALCASRPHVDEPLTMLALARHHKLPARLTAALLRGLDRQPDRRWPSMRALVDELGRLAARRRRVHVVLGVLAFMLANLVLVVWLLGRGSAPPDPPGAAEQAQPESVMPPTQPFPTRQPIGMWTFDEGEGRLALDQTGRTGPATLDGNAMWTLDVAPIRSANSSALRLDGVDSFAWIADHPNLHFGANQEFSVALWFKADPVQHDTYNTDNDLLEKWSATGPYPFVLRIANHTAELASPPAVAGQVVFGRYDSMNGPTVRSPLGYLDGRYHHTAAVKQGDELLLYVDGELVARLHDSIELAVDNTSPLLIGRRGGHDDKNHFAGNIDDLHIYARALSQDEVVALMRR